jgi:hypothetical protein
MLKHHKKFDLEAINKDKRNLWSIVGLAHEDVGDERHDK